MARLKTASGLSMRQERMLEFISRFIGDNARPPTVREIGDAVGINSTSVVDYNLKILQRNRLIKRDSKISRGIEVVHALPRSRRPTIPVAISGRIAAGEPIEAVADNSETLELPIDLAAEGAYALRVKGQSMIEDLIDDGDLVVVRPQSSADNGDIVVALITDGPSQEGAATLKRFYRERDRIRLQPANSQMEPIYVRPENVSVQGKVIALIRQFG